MSSDEKELQRKRERDDGNDSEALDSEQLTKKANLSSDEIAAGATASTVPEEAPSGLDGSTVVSGQEKDDQDKDFAMVDQSAAREHSGADMDANGATEVPVPAAPVQMQMRSLIVTQDASIIIGKGGKHVNEIRDKSGAKLTISESIPGNTERIMSVTGALDAVSKVCPSIISRSTS